MVIFILTIKTKNVFLCRGAGISKFLVSPNHFSRRNLPLPPDSFRVKGPSLYKVRVFCFFFEPLIPLGKDISVHKLRGKFSDPPTLCPYLVKGDAMNLTLIYNNVTSFPSWILPMLSWFYVQDRYLSCSRTIEGSSFQP